ncbi:uncharacterized protein LOC121356451 isoform X3 [Pyrgilauda ruficollis]|uniref:uncharacterized protein LOC121356451 isoform X3 n=1 Tax=Pyrgilauda ruficollis TaxID=221976 RepID=UPI001B873BF4|nr:uncharacterized protein LOC121356451 isoform X3 [Pyrgilauda ruficollis]
MNALTKEASCKPRPQRKRSNSRPPETDSLLRKSDGTKVLTGSSTELASKQTLLMGKFSCISHLLSEPGDFLEEQLPEISLADSLTDLSHSIESSRKSSSAVLSVSSRLREVPASKSLSTEGNRMPAKPPVWLKKSLIFKEETAEEIPGERNQVQSSSWSSPSQESAVDKQTCYNWSELYFVEREEVCSPVLLLADSTWKGAVTTGPLSCWKSVGCWYQATTGLEQCQGSVSLQLGGCIRALI